jgi:hypothetical protein
MLMSTLGGLAVIGLVGIALPLWAQQAGTNPPALPSTPAPATHFPKPVLPVAKPATPPEPERIDKRRDRMKDRDKEIDRMMKQKPKQN